MTQPKREFWAAENVCRQGFEYYLPLVQRAIRNGRVRSQIGEPLFQRYLFVHIRNGQWRCLLGTFGVSGVVLASELPVRLPVSAIADLRSRQDEDGFIKLPRLAPGTRLRIKSGALRGQIGIYQSQRPQERVEVLLQLLSGSIKTLISLRDLEVA